MTEPRIQYVKTSDGVNIAYATAGSGPPLVYIQATFLSHVQLEWEQPVLRAGFEAIVASGAMLVRFDPRGTGLSDRDVGDVSSSAFVRDLEAVVGQLHLERFPLLANEWGAATALKYATLRPEQVSRLILINPVSGGAEHQTARGKKWQSLADDWELLTETIAAMAFGFGYAESTKYAAFMRAAIDQETFRRLIAESVDLAALGEQLQVPTLVIRHTGVTWLTGDAARALAAAIPDCRMVSIEGIYIDHPDQTGRAIREFLAPDLQEPSNATGVTTRSSAQHSGASSLRIVLFTDLVGHTEMMSRLGDERGREVLREHERITRDVLKEHSGTEVKTMGDGFMVSFTSVTQAMDCAIALQRSFAEHNASSSEPLQVRIGLNAGEPIAEDDPGGRGDLFGTAVNMAARIAAKAEGGEILASNVVRELVAGKEFLFNDRGDTELRGFEDPVRVYEVRWREDG